LPGGRLSSGVNPHNVLTMVGLDPGPTCIHCMYAIGNRVSGAAPDTLEVALEHPDVPAITSLIEHTNIMDHIRN
jgi:hypothetical protein